LGREALVLAAAVHGLVALQRNGTSGHLGIRVAYSMLRPGGIGYISDSDFTLVVEARCPIVLVATYVRATWTAVVEIGRCKARG
jgi:hypothetical protein